MNEWLVIAAMSVACGAVWYGYEMWKEHRRAKAAAAAFRESSRKMERH